MPSFSLVLIALALLASGGLCAYCFPERSPAGRRLGAALSVAAGLCGLLGLGLFFSGGGAAENYEAPWFLPFGACAVGLDSLSAVFLVLVFVVPPLGSVYGLGYWKAEDGKPKCRRLQLSYGLLAAAMGLVVVARDGVLFLMAWETMALAAYFAATVEDDRKETREAGWIYLIATHIGTLCLFAMFALWARDTGSFALDPARLGALNGSAGAVFVLALVGFGFKAGLMPLHVWLPGAHANAPSHVSALMSGAMLKMGVYGLLRMTMLMPAPEYWWGGVLIALGAATGILGIAYAAGQSDLKRCLAYSSIENVGIIAMGAGLALVGKAAGRQDLALLGLAGALFHTLNHGLFKSLLFYGAGSVVHASGTRELNGLGGLYKKIPATAKLFLIGSVAICALPPLNGFAGEWLLYIGFFKALDGQAAAAVGAVALATIGALAVLCFVRLYSGVFLGVPRGNKGERARESGPAMLIPMGLLAAACAAAGLAPGAVLKLLEPAVSAWTGIAAPAGAEAPLGWIGLLSGSLVLGLAALVLLLRFSWRGRPSRTRGTWDCGYAAPTARMQYTPASWSAGAVKMFSFALLPRRGKPKIEGSFPAPSAMEESVPDAALDRVAVPAFRKVADLLPRIRVLQIGQTHFYVAYIFLIVLILFGIGFLGGQR